MIITIGSNWTRNKVAIFISFDMRNMNRNLAQSYTAGWSSITCYSKALIICVSFLRGTLTLGFFWSVIVNFLADFYPLLHIIISYGRSSICAHRRRIIILICGVFIKRTLIAVQEHLIAISRLLATGFSSSCIWLNHLLLKL